MGIAAMVFGILGVVLFWIPFVGWLGVLLGLLSVLLGIVSMIKAGKSEDKGGKAFGLIGIVLGLVALIGGAVIQVGALMAANAVLGEVEALQQGTSDGSQSTSPDQPFQ